MVDGAIGDTDEIQALGFPICTRAIVPRSTHSSYSQRMEPIEVNVPISCGGLLPLAPGHSSSLESRYLSAATLNIGH